MSHASSIINQSDFICAPHFIQTKSMSVVLQFVITTCCHMVALQYNRWCMTRMLFMFHDMAVMPCLHTGCHYGISCCRVKTVDLHFPSPSLSAQVCTIMRAEAEACMCD